MITAIENMNNEFRLEIPEPPQFESEILFAGNRIEDQYWSRTPMPRFTSSRHREKYWEDEFSRCWVTGAWIVNNGELTYLPPNYYFFLRYWRINRSYPQFRKKRHRHTLFKAYVRNDPRLIGSYTIKNRRDGETIMAMSDLIWEALPCEQGLFGIQSKTGDDAKDVCWRNLMIGFKALPRIMKVDDYGNPIYQGSDDPKRVLALKKPAQFATKSNFIVDEDSDLGEEDSETLLYWRSTSSNAFDGREMRKIVIDEFNKWEEDSAFDAYTTYIDCILQGKNRRGLMDIFSSPAETAGRHNDEALKFWQMCDPKNLGEDGVVKSRCPRWFSNPLDGIESFYDKYGDADPDQIFEWIMKRRANTSIDKLNNEIRKYPLNETEAFETFDNTAQWANIQQIQKRKIYVGSTEKKESGGPKYLNVKLGWQDGMKDTEPVMKIVGELYIQNPRDHHLLKGPWLVSYDYFDKLPALNDWRKPPKKIDSILGIDPYDYRRTKKGGKPSLGAGCVYKFGDIYRTGIERVFPMVYIDRPRIPEDFYEQMLLGALISRSKMQVENKNRNLMNYIEDRKYWDWLLPTEIEGDPNEKGNSPGNNAFMDDACGILDSLLSDNDFLETLWFDHVLYDLIQFNREDTQVHDPTMAILQAVYGAYKIIMATKKRKPMGRDFVDALAGYL